MSQFINMEFTFWKEFEKELKIITHFDNKCKYLMSYQIKIKKNHWHKNNLGYILNVKHKKTNMLKQANISIIIIKIISIIMSMTSFI